MADAERLIGAPPLQKPLPQAFTYCARDYDVQCTCLPGTVRQAKDMILCTKDSSILVWSHQPCQLQELTSNPQDASTLPSEVWQRTLSELNELWLASKAIAPKQRGETTLLGTDKNRKVVDSPAAGILNPSDGHNKAPALLKHASITFRCDAPCQGSDRLVDWFWCKKCCGWQHRGCMLYGEPGDRGGPVCNICYKHFFDHIHEYRAWQKQRQLEVVRHAWAFLNEADLRDNEWRVAQAWRLNLVKAFLWGFLVEHRRQFLLEDQRRVAVFEQQSHQPGVLVSVYKRRELQQKKFGRIDDRERTDEDSTDMQPLQEDDAPFMPETLKYNHSRFGEDRQLYRKAPVPPKMLPMAPLPRNASQMEGLGSHQGLMHPPTKRTASIFHAETPSQTPAQLRSSKRPKTRERSPEPESRELVLCSCNPRPDMTNTLSFACRRCGQDQHATCAVAMRVAGKTRGQALLCNDCHSAHFVNAAASTSGVHVPATSSSSDAEYVQSMRSEIEALSSTILWKLWWELPLSSQVIYDTTPFASPAPPVAHQAFMLECTTRLSNLLITAGQDLSNEMLTPALATFPRRPGVILKGLQALIEAVLPNLRPPWGRLPRPRVLSENEKSRFGVLLEIVGLVSKGDVWTFGKSIGWD